jgi:hypothetical protein
LLVIELAGTLVEHGAGIVVRQTAHWYPCDDDAIRHLAQTLISAETDDCEERNKRQHQDPSRPYWRGRN